MFRFSRMAIPAFLLFFSIGNSALAGTASPSFKPGMPEEIRPLTEVNLTRDQYQNLADQWLQYSGDNPASAMAHVMIYKALYYHGDQNAEKLQAHITKALEIDPLCPEALSAAMDTALRHSNPMGTRRECYEFGLKAVAAAPNWANPHAMLYILGTLLNRPEEASLHLVAMLEKDYFSPALIDYGYNMLTSAAPGGIIITNGDNDTYPCLALQAAHGIRTDVTIANISLMTFQPLARQYLTTATRDHAAALEVQEMDDVEQDFLEDRAAYGGMLGAALLEHLCFKASTETLKRPLYLAVTLSPKATKSCGSSLVLEGLLMRVVPSATDEPSEPVTDISKTYKLFSQDYRLESATDFATNWNRLPAHEELVRNYANILFRLGYDAGTNNDQQIMEFGFEESMKIASFHKNEATMKLVLNYWEKLDPGSEKLKMMQEDYR